MNNRSSVSVSRGYFCEVYPSSTSAAVSNIKFELSCKSGGKCEHKVDVASDVTAEAAQSHKFWMCFCPAASLSKPKFDSNSGRGVELFRIAAFAFK